MIRVREGRRIGGFGALGGFGSPAERVEDDIGTGSGGGLSMTDLILCWVFERREPVDLIMLWLDLKRASLCNCATIIILFPMIGVFMAQIVDLASHRNVEKRSRDDLLREIIQSKDVFFSDLDYRAHDLKARIWAYMGSIDRSENYNPKITISLRYDAKSGMPRLTWVRLTEGYVWKNAKKHRRSEYVKGLRDGRYPLRIFNGLREEDRHQLIAFEMEARGIREELAMFAAMFRHCAEILNRSGEPVPVIDSDRD